MDQLEQLHPQSFGWALCCCRRDPARAEDVLQQVYLKVLSGKARHSGQGSFKTWLFAVIRLTARDDARRRWLGVLRLHRSALPEPQGLLADTLDPAAQTRALLQALAALPQRQREVLHLVFYQELSIADAAEVLGISLGTARTHYERGKAALREKLATDALFQVYHDPRRPKAAGALL